MNSTTIGLHLGRKNMHWECNDPNEASPFASLGMMGTKRTKARFNSRHFENAGTCPNEGLPTNPARKDRTRNIFWRSQKERNVICVCLAVLLRYNLVCRFCASTTLPTLQASQWGPFWFDLCSSSAPCQMIKQAKRNPKFQPGGRAVTKEWMCFAVEI